MVPGINFRKGKRCLFLFLFIFVNYARIVVTESGVLMLWFGAFATKDIPRISAAPLCGAICVVAFDPGLKSM